VSLSVLFFKLNQGVENEIASSCGFDAAGFEYAGGDGNASLCSGAAGWQ
jgi:hypothetical protein